MSEKIKTLQECKDEVAHGDCWTSWHEALDKARKDFLDNIIDRAAELYAQQFKSSPNQLEKEIEELKQENSKLSDRYTRLLNITEQKSFEDKQTIDRFASTSMRLAKELNALEQSNTELLEALRAANSENRTLRARCIGLQDDKDTKL